MRARVCSFLCVPDDGRVCGVLTQLAFSTLTNCHGIWLFSVNAISHAECLVNGCLPIAGPTSFRSSPFLSSPSSLTSPPLSVS